MRTPLTLCSPLTLRSPILALPLLLAACAPPPAATQEEIRPVLTAIAMQSKNPIMASYSGEIRARHESRLAFKVAGKVMQRMVEVGTRVRPGQVLMRLDAQDAALSEQSAAAQAESARIKLEQSYLDLQRYVRLHQEGFVSKASLDQFRLAQDTAASQLRSAQAQQRLSLNQRRYATLVAEREGVVTAVETEIGQVVSIGQPVLAVAIDGERDVAVSIPEARVDELRQARYMTVTTWVNPQRNYRATLRELAPDADRVTRTYAARVRIEDQDPALMLGMTASVHVEQHASQGTIRIPLGALQHKDGRTWVWVVAAQDSTVSPREVKVSGTQHDGILIGAGLREGECIVGAGVHLLQPGQKVKRLADADLRGA